MQLRTYTCIILICFSFLIGCFCIPSYCIEQSGTSMTTPTSGTSMTTPTPSRSTATTSMPTVEESPTSHGMAVVASMCSVLHLEMLPGGGGDQTGHGGWGLLHRSNHHIKGFLEAKLCVCGGGVRMTLPSPTLNGQPVFIHIIFVCT